MARHTSAHPTEVEQEILQVLWRKGPLTVQQVRKELALRRKLHTSSVHTVLKIMIRKGFVIREKRSREIGSLFMAAVGQRDTARKMIRSIIERLFGRSSRSLLQGLLGGHELEPDEVLEIKNILRERRADKGSEKSSGGGRSR